MMSSSSSTIASIELALQQSLDALRHPIEPISGLTCIGAVCDAYEQWEENLVDVLHSAVRQYADPESHLAPPVAPKSNTISTFIQSVQQQLASGFVALANDHSNNVSVDSSAASGSRPTTGSNRRSLLQRLPSSTAGDTSTSPTANATPPADYRINPSAYARPASGVRRPLLPASVKPETMYVPVSQHGSNSSQSNSMFPKLVNAQEVAAQSVQLSNGVAPLPDATTTVASPTSAATPTSPSSSSFTPLASLSSPSPPTAAKSSQRYSLPPAQASNISTAAPSSRTYCFDAIALLIRTLQEQQTRIQALEQKLIEEKLTSSKSSTMETPVSETRSTIPSVSTTETLFQTPSESTTRNVATVPAVETAAASAEAVTPAEPTVSTTTATSSRVASAAPVARKPTVPTTVQPKPFVVSASVPHAAVGPGLGPSNTASKPVAMTTTESYAARLARETEERRRAKEEEKLKALKEAQAHAAAEAEKERKRREATKLLLAQQKKEKEEKEKAKAEAEAAAAKAAKQKEKEVQAKRKAEKEELDRQKKAKQEEEAAAAALAAEKKKQKRASATFVVPAVDATAFDTALTAATAPATVPATTQSQHSVSTPVTATPIPTPVATTDAPAATAAPTSPAKSATASKSVTGSEKPAEAVAVKGKKRLPGGGGAAPKIATFEIACQADAFSIDSTVDDTVFLRKQYNFTPEEQEEAKREADELNQLSVSEQISKLKLDLRYAQLRIKGLDAEAAAALKRIQSQKDELSKQGFIISSQNAELTDYRMENVKLVSTGLKSEAEKIKEQQADASTSEAVALVAIKSQTDASDASSISNPLLSLPPPPALAEALMANAAFLQWMKQVFELLQSTEKRRKEAEKKIAEIWENGRQAELTTIEYLRENEKLKGQLEMLIKSSKRV